MDGTRRYWIGMGLAGALALGAVLTARPVLLLGAAMIGASLLARQYVFIRTVVRMGEHLAVEEAVDRETIVTEETTTVTLRAHDPLGSSLELTLASRPPIATRVDGERTIRLTDASREAHTAFEVTWPVAGSFRFDPPQLTVRDRHGLFRRRLPIEPRATPAITVKARQPQEIHIGAGGDQITAAYGEHEAAEMQSGIEPDVLREYTAEDAANRIDWKTTARLGEPFVREYEADTDRDTVLLIDTRACMQQGPPGETKLDYTRHVALALADSAHELKDPLGLYVVDESGLVDGVRPTSQNRQYISIRERILDLEPDDADADDVTDTASAHRTPAATHRSAMYLTDSSAFTTRLRPYLEDTTTHVQRIDRDPLFNTVRSHIRQLRGALWTVIITDDTHRGELREAVTLARRGNERVLVFLAPTVLFEEGGLSDVGTAYERYLEFERFRRQLARLDRVSAFEIGPGDRLSTILSSGARRQKSRQRTPSSPSPPNA
ncbi:DUF58 domain-containing protein [Halalkalicoccus salilacus]|uniref:DUF58 domain-containing protein n=1 Tax=Halalkalicoccus TaxID=332246 RepID=UPI002F96DF9B